MKFQAFCSCLLAAINISEQVTAIRLGSSAEVESEYNAFGDEANWQTLSTSLAQVTQMGGIYDAVTMNPYSRPCAGKAGAKGSIGAQGPKGKTGDSGERGEKGADGPTGAIGNKGTVGP